jgi:hypothetical protein
MPSEDVRAHTSELRYELRELAKEHGRAVRKWMDDSDIIDPEYADHLLEGYYEDLIYEAFGAKTANGGSASRG